MIIQEGDYLAHYGILRRSGRYPWGSGGPESASNAGFLGYVESLAAKGLTEKQIADGLGTTTTALRAAKSIAKNEKKQGDIHRAQALKDKGYSNIKIGEAMGINESSVRSLLAPGAKERADVLLATSNMLKDQIEQKKYIQIGAGVENHLGISGTKLATAIAVLQEEGYKVQYLKVMQQGTGKFTSVKVLTKPDVSYSELYKNRDQVSLISPYSEDGGHTFKTIQPPASISSKRVSVRYAEQGGKEADGVIYVRPGVEDVSLGKSNYAQVRIAVDGTHYIKGMAIYKNDLPPGVDLQFNTNKSDTGHMLDALKKMNDDPENRFGAVITRQHGVMNILSEEGDWGEWSKTLSSQFLSKQSPTLAKTQLAMAFERKKNEFDSIMALNNPAVKSRLLQGLADDADSSAVHLKAAHLPRQATHVIIPVPGLKENEVYAPKYMPGERVALVRHPHAGTFEIPELTVNNSHPEAKALLGGAKDAIGINAKVAERLSGADFDGDTVLVIPNNTGSVKSTRALEGLKNFDAKREYAGYEGMKTLPEHQIGRQMGDISNLITDMTIGGASTAELARAVRHSMVVIDAYKHGLNYKLSAQQNGIAALKTKYQGAANAGAHTLISSARSKTYINERKQGYQVDPSTGRKIYRETGRTRTDAKGNVVRVMQPTKKLAEIDNAHALSTGTVMEKIYADHSNKLKDLGDRARKEMVHTPSVVKSPSAEKAYATQVTRLNAALNIALMNKPLERQAQLIADTQVNAKRHASPDMTKDQIKKLRFSELERARAAVGARKTKIDISPDEWAAIQAGAFSHSKLSKILDHADLDVVKEYATPRNKILMTSAKTARARQMLQLGYNQGEVAAALGVSLSTLQRTME